MSASDLVALAIDRLMTASVHLDRGYARFLVAHDISTVMQWLEFARTELGENEKEDRRNA